MVKKKQSKKKGIQIPISVDRMFPYKNKSTRAFVDLNYGNLKIKGLRVVKGKNGLFVSMPSELNAKDKEYYPRVMTLKDSTFDAIESLVLGDYREQIKDKSAPKAKAEEIVDEDIL